LGFGKVENEKISFKCLNNLDSDNFGNFYIGELNEKGQKHGRGLYCDDNQNIIFAKFENDKKALGYTVKINKD